jgi:hypothetical protein
MSNSFDGEEKFEEILEVKEDEIIWRLCNELLNLIYSAPC